MLWANPPGVTPLPNFIYTSYELCLNRTLATTPAIGTPGDAGETKAGVAHLGCEWTGIAKEMMANEVQTNSGEEDSWSSAPYTSKMGSSNGGQLLLQRLHSPENSPLRTQTQLKNCLLAGRPEVQASSTLNPQVWSTSLV